MNDPFELLSVDLSEPDDRTTFDGLKADLNQTIGVLCFSRGWSNPVLWSHYGDRHRRGFVWVLIYLTSGQGR